MSVEGVPRRIVVGIDGSPASVAALRWAAGQARLSGAQLDVVIAWEYPSFYGWAPGLETMDFSEQARAVLEETVREALGTTRDRSVNMHVVPGHPAAVLVRAAADADLLVVGSRGYGGFTGMLLGSVSEHAVQHAPCPVVVVRGDAARRRDRDRTRGRVTSGRR